MIKDYRRAVLSSAIKKHYEARDDFRFTNAQFSYNPAVVKAGKLYDYYSGIGDEESAQKILELVNRLVNTLKGVSIYGPIQGSNISPIQPVNAAYLLTELGEILITEDGNAIIL